MENPKFCVSSSLDSTIIHLAATYHSLIIRKAGISLEKTVL